MKQKNKKLLLLGSVIFLIVMFYWSGLYHFITLESIQKNLSFLQAQRRGNSAFFLSVFILIYVVITSLSIPGTIILTLMSGAIFGVVPGTFYSTFSSTVGATIAFLMSRYIFQKSVKKKFEDKFSSINSKMKENGNLYLLTLRIIPISPYVLVNMLMGLTNIRTLNFFVLTFIGMLPGTFIYVYAGKKILQIKRIADVMSPEIILALFLIGIAPIIIRLFRKPDKLISDSGQ